MPYTLAAFSEDAFAECIKIVSPKNSLQRIKRKHHFKYFMSYLGSPDIATKTIVAEKKYLSKSYLSDYAYYYSKCYEGYSKFTGRLHFFSRTFTEAEFETALLKTDENSNAIWKSYIGYIVIKPIFQTLFGATILKNYPNAGPATSRVFFGIRDYKVNLFGHTSTIKSLAFQEQDSAVSACATTAIWCCLHKASNENGSMIKTPSEITRSAGITGVDGNRLFPNRGLNLVQMANAIVDAGLETEIRHINGDYLYLKELIHAYSPIGIPTILVIDVQPGTNQLHAVTITGLRFIPAPIIPKSNPNEPIRTTASLVEKVYAHDDQHGPFIRMSVFDDGLSSPWNNRVSVLHAIIPVYSKIRISYDDILMIVDPLNKILSLVFFSLLPEGVIWDIKVEYSNDWKSKIKDSILDDKQKLKILKSDLPKYLWVASVLYMGQMILELIFDATDLQHGMIAEGIICPFSDMATYTKQAMTTHKASLLPIMGSHDLGEDYYDFVVDNL